MLRWSRHFAGPTFLVCVCVAASLCEGTLCVMLRVAVFAYVRTQFCVCASFVLSFLCVRFGLSSLSVCLCVGLEGL